MSGDEHRDVGGEPAVGAAGSEARGDGKAGPQHAAGDQLHRGDGEGFEGYGADVQRPHSSEGLQIQRQ